MQHLLHAYMLHQLRAEVNNGQVITNVVGLLSSRTALFTLANAQPWTSTLALPNSLAKWNMPDAIYMRHSRQTTKDRRQKTIMFSK